MAGGAADSAQSFRPMTDPRRSSEAGFHLALAVVAGIVIFGFAAATLVVRVSTTTPGSCPASGDGNTPFSTPLALSSPMEASAGFQWWYNFTIQAAGGGLTFDQLSFRFTTPAGANVTPAGLIGINVLAINGEVIAEYSIARGYWPIGGAEPVLSGYVLAAGPMSTTLSGDMLSVVVTAGCGFGATVTDPIP